MNGSAWLDEVQWNEDGLVPVIAQEQSSGQVLMMAWMNREALLQTVTTGYAVYWSRSRQELWAKGEVSGHRQQLKELRLDCDQDALLMVVDQQGGIACHTGRHHCFFRRLENKEWRCIEPVIREPGEIYGDDRS